MAFLFLSYPRTATGIESEINTVNIPAILKDPNRAITNNQIIEYIDAKEQYSINYLKIYGENYCWCNDPDFIYLENLLVNLLSPGCYEILVILHLKCVEDSMKLSGINILDDPLLKRLHEMGPFGYPWAVLDFFKIWRKSAADYISKTGREYDYCNDPYFQKYRMMPMHLMVRREYEFFMYCRSQCLQEYFDEGYVYFPLEDEHYKKVKARPADSLTLWEKQYLLNLESEAHHEKYSIIRYIGLTAAGTFFPIIGVILTGFLTTPFR